jgi:Nickel responsive protein SCO4226-like
MSSYLLEAYTPASALLEEVEARVRSAAAELSESGTPVPYVRSIFVPEDETCFHVLDGPSSEAVAETAKRAGISTPRITKAVP